MNFEFFKINIELKKKIQVSRKLVILESDVERSEDRAGHSQQ